MAPLIHVNNHQKTKILATVGPASSSKEALLDLVQAGVNVFRLNFSHGAHSEHQKVIDNILEINEQYKVHVLVFWQIFRDLNFGLVKWKIMAWKSSKAIS
jgi:pyruvate kinase